MKFSTRTIYGLKAILILAGRFGAGSVSVSQIAKKEGLSVAYLEQILNALKKKGLVKSVRGPQGGYILAKKPSEISLETLLYALEDQAFAGVQGKLSITTETDEAAIANFLFWKKLKSSIEQGLGNYTLKELTDESRRLKKSKPQTAHPFHI